MRYKSYHETFDASKAPDNPTRQQYIFTTVDCTAQLNDDCILTEEVSVNGPDLFAYNNGKLIQDAFPYLTATQRERLMSGTCGACFANLMKED